MGEEGREKRRNRLNDEGKISKKIEKVGDGWEKKRAEEKDREGGQGLKKEVIV